MSVLNLPIKGRIEIEIWRCVSFMMSYTFNMHESNLYWTFGVTFHFFSALQLVLQVII